MLNKMTQFQDNEAGFTLVELLIVVVIIGLLAGVATPVYTRYILTSRAAEAPAVLEAMITYARSYAEAHSGNYPSTANWWFEFTPGGAGSGIYFTYEFSAPTLTAKGISNNGFSLSDTLAYNLSAGIWTSGGVLVDIQPSP